MNAVVKISAVAYEHTVICEHNNTVIKFGTETYIQ
jgi:hypothetical protein